MKILFDSSIYSLQSTGGITRMFNELIPRLAALDPEVQIQFFQTGLLKQPLPQIKNVKVFDYGYLDLLFRPRRIWQNNYEKIYSFIGNKIITSQKSTIWHSTYYNDFFGWKGKKVVTVHDMIYEMFPRLFSQKFDQNFIRQKKKTINNSDTVICVSNTTKQDLINLYSLQDVNIHILYHGVSPSFQKIDHKIIPQEYRISFPYIMFVGKRTHNKNFLEFIKAYSKWNKKKEINVLAVGQKWKKDEIRILKELQIFENVILMSNIDDGQLAYLYNQALAFIYPSLYEGFGIPLLESMACGCPIVASNIPSTNEIAHDIPVYFEIGDVESFLFALEKGVYRRNKPKTTQKGILRAKEFSWDDSAKKLLQIYKNLNR